MPNKNLAEFVKRLWSARFYVLGVDLSPTAMNKERIVSAVLFDSNLRRLLSPYLDIASVKERKDDISYTEEFESVEVIAGEKKEEA